MSEPSHAARAQGQGAPLAGLKIVITRPMEQAAPLLERIQTLGGEAIPLPLLDIIPSAAAPHPHTFRQQCQRADLIIFVSPTAARLACQRLPRPAWPSDARLACVGQGTARTLRAHGFDTILVPPVGADSEALLALPELEAVRGQHILLVRGEGGRTLLADTLAARGAHISHAVLYRRHPRPPDMHALRQRGPLLFVLTSTEALQVLVEAARAQASLDWLKQQGLLFAHPRIAAHGQALGLPPGHGAASPSDDAILAALLRLADDVRQA